MAPIAFEWANPGKENWCSLLFDSKPKKCVLGSQPFEKLTTEKKAHNLTEQYRVDDVCTLSTLKEWQEKLRQTCGN